MSLRQVDLIYNGVTNVPYFDRLNTIVNTICHFNILTIHYSLREYLSTYTRCAINYLTLIAILFYCF